MPRRRRVTSPRAVLLAGVSMLALTVAASQASAADKAPSPKPVAKAPPPVLKLPPPPPPVLTMWVEGAAIFTAGGAMSAFNPVGPAFSPSLPAGPDFVGQTPGVGWEFAFGADYRLPFDPGWHVNFDFRHGYSRASDANFSRGFSTATGATFNTSASQSKFTENEDHTVADLMIGRDFGFGATTAQVKFGVRVADLRARQDVQAQHASHHGTSSSQSQFGAGVNLNTRSEFFGVGPRLAAEGSTPLGGPWGIDWGGGLAVLFGQQRFNADTNGIFDATNSSGAGQTFTFSGNLCNAPVNAGIGTIHPLSCTSDRAVFNADASMAVSYALTQQLKLSAGMRFDGYWNALPTLDPAVVGGVHNEDRFYWGPFVRLTGQFGGSPPPSSKLVLKAPPPAPLSGLTMWVEGAAIWTAGGGMNAFNPVGPASQGSAAAGPDFVRQTPAVGWEAAFGTDYLLPGDPGWHVSFDFRHGHSKAHEANFAQQNFATFASGDGFSVTSNQAKFTENEEHTVADLMIGRDFGFGGSTAQVKFGVRVADLRANQNVQAQGAFQSTLSGTRFTKATGVNISEHSEFFGVGPRLAAEGSTPIGGLWGIDWGGGLAVLFGQQRFNADVNGVFASTANSSGGGQAFTFNGNACNATINTGVGTIHPLSNCTSETAVFNADASAALSYAISPVAKLSAGIRFDGYWKALPTLNGALQNGGPAGITNEDRFYWGPFVRLTGHF